jgi:hypothetical protein
MDRKIERQVQFVIVPKNDSFAMSQAQPARLVQNRIAGKNAIALE